MHRNICAVILNVAKVPFSDAPLIQNQRNSDGKFEKMTQRAIYFAGLGAAIDQQQCQYRDHCGEPKANVPGKTRPWQIKNEEHGFGDDNQDPEVREITMNEIGIVIERQSDEERGSYKPKGISFWRVTHLGHYFYRIAFVQHAFYHHRTVDAGHTFVRLRYFL